MEKEEESTQTGQGQQKEKQMILTKGSGSFHTLCNHFGYDHLLADSLEVVVCPYEVDENGDLTPLQNDDTRPNFYCAPDRLKLIQAIRTTWDLGLRESKDIVDEHFPRANVGVLVRAPGGPWRLL